jgi:hypothetical protein
MAARQPNNLLSKEMREKLQRELKVPADKLAVALAEDACRTCGKDDDHANLLLCDKCDAHYHIYCLIPALKKIPTDEWFCPPCETYRGDGLDELVAALPPAITCRFGEIVWAQGGSGYGWWPSCIFDPRLTIGVTRAQARKQIGKKFLVYFLQCDDTLPFDLLHDKKIVTWEQGLSEDFHIGKAAKAAGKNRFKNFQQALQAATMEQGKALEYRLDITKTTNQQGPQLLPSPAKQLKQRKKEKPVQPDGQAERSKARRTGVKAPPEEDAAKKAPNSRKRRLEAAFEEEDEEEAEQGLYCRIYVSTDDQTAAVGFVELQKDATLGDARTTIGDTLEPQLLPSEWRFLHPTLGPISMRMETTNLLGYLKKHGMIGAKNQGTINNPVQVTITKAPELAVASAAPGT